MMKIIVASKNPVKIQAALDGFRTMFPSEVFEVEGASAPSGVSDQPKTEAETLQGAVNRVEHIAQSAIADFYVGLEGGIEAKGTDMEAFAWIIVKSKDGKIGKGRTGSFFLPPKIIELINQGKELGEADDIVFGQTNSKQQHGAVGILTGNVTTRTDYYARAVILALIPFRNQHLY